MKTVLKNLLRPFYRKGKSFAKNAKMNIRYMLSQVFCKIPKQSDIPIEVCLVTVQKDFDTLKLCLESIRKFVRHPITKISIVSKENELIKEFCDSNSCVFVNELSILDYVLEKFQNMNEANLKGREGWFFQQFLKLGFDKICEQEHYLVVDTDTIFLKPRIFKFGKTTIFEYSDEWHIPYQNAYKKIMGFGYSSDKSFVTHCMLFEKAILKELKSYIENKHKVSWDNAIIETADYSSTSFFSEYETYGNFFLHFHKNNVKRIYWFNYASSNFINAEEYPFWAKSLSSHAYLRPNVEPSLRVLEKVSKVADILGIRYGGEVKNIFEFSTKGKHSTDAVFVNCETLNSLSSYERKSLEEFSRESLIT